MTPKLNKKNRAAVDKCLKAFLELQAVDPLFATQFIHELSFLLRDPSGFIAASSPDDRADVVEMIYGPHSKQSQ